MIAELGESGVDFLFSHGEKGNFLEINPSPFPPTATYEIFTSVSTLLLDLSEDLNGKHRDIALAIHQLSELGVLLTARLLDREAPCPG
ncbi:hypothetical protein HU731_006255 [Pseudomonas salmasensis]|nr:hypothetical protein HU731_006255 [Pseudomonas salmasensis]